MPWRVTGKADEQCETSLFNGVRTNSSSRGRLPDAKWLPSGHGSYKIAHKLVRVSCRTNKRSPGRRRGVMIRFGECNDETTSLGFVLLVLWHIARATCLNIVSFFPTISSWIRKLRIKEFVAIAAYYGKITAMASYTIFFNNKTDDFVNWFRNFVNVKRYRLSKRRSLDNVQYAKTRLHEGRIRILPVVLEISPNIRALTGDFYFMLHVDGR